LQVDTGKDTVYRLPSTVHQTNGLFTAAFADLRSLGQLFF
jgi:hypothetical protein